MRNDYRKAYLETTHSLADVLENLNKTGFKISLVVDKDETLLGIITDWDVRTALLKGVSLLTGVSGLMNSKPVVGRDTMTATELRDVMTKHKNEALPVVDENNRVTNLVLLRDYVPRDNHKCPIVIMAGGAGKRLWPLTLTTPKPLLPINERPILGHILNHIEAQGFEDIWVMTHYKSEMIENFLTADAPKSLNINVIREENPMGTGGSLKFLHNQALDRPIFVMNGDILTRINFHDMLEWHHANNNVLTLGSRHFQYQVPYGVLNTEGQRLVQLEEKPVQHFNINAGIYLIDPMALQYIPDNRYFDMTDLIEVLLSSGQQVGTFPISEAWIDIGQPEDYARVNQDSEQYISVGV